LHNLQIIYNTSLNLTPLARRKLAQSLGIATFEISISIAMRRRVSMFSNVPVPQNAIGQINYYTYNDIPYSHGEEES